jgi:hypothetical protein
MPWQTINELTTQLLLSFKGNCPKVIDFCERYARDSRDLGNMEIAEEYLEVARRLRRLMGCKHTQVRRRGYQLVEDEGHFGEMGEFVIDESDVEIHADTFGDMGDVTYTCVACSQDVQPEDCAPSETKPCSS